MDKKGVFFTAMAIFLISLFFISYSIYDVVSDRDAIEARIESLNNFVFSIEADMSRQLYITGFRTIFILENEIIETGQAVDVNNSLQELFFNGSLNDEDMQLMQGARLEDMADRLQDWGEKINVNVTLDDVEIYFYQEDAWHINTKMHAHLLVEDLADLVLWNKTIETEAKIPITNFEDPLYLLETNGAIANKIKKTPYTFSDDSNLSNHVSGGYYLASSEGISFINRLEGKQESSQYGIESFVDLSEFSAQGLSTKDKSCIDHIYFSSDNPNSCPVSGMPSWFRIDEETDGRYGLSVSC
ncbi:MAG: hypothetical protein ACP5D2_01460 [Candidatus Nanoarchaeia archaeon]